MKVFWTSQALLDRAAIWDDIAADNPAAAAGMDVLFSEAVSRLKAHPLMGKPGLVQATREVLVCPSYRLVFEINHQEVWILALVHTARLWPPER
jgi:hypothetical protein